MPETATQQRMTGGQAWLTPLRFPRAAALLGKLLHLAYRLRGRHRYDDFRMERLLGARFLVLPTVLNPNVTRTGAFFASQLDSRPLHADAEVLDMGTGSGVCAVFAARWARRVVAVDINPEATRCARINATLNRLEHKIETRHGDLFDPVATERFDLVLFNPPFVRGTPRDERERAWRSVDVAERFAAGLADHLKPDGMALVLLSTFGDARMFLEEFRARAYETSVLAERRYVNERLALLRVVPRPRPS